MIANHCVCVCCIWWCGFTDLFISLCEEMEISWCFSGHGMGVVQFVVAHKLISYFWWPSCWKHMVASYCCCYLHRFWSVIITMQHLTLPFFPSVGFPSLSAIAAVLSYHSQYSPFSTSQSSSACSSSWVSTSCDPAFPDFMDFATGMVIEGGYFMHNI